MFLQFLVFGGIIEKSHLYFEGKTVVLYSSFKDA